MLFNSPAFIFLFLPVVVFVYFALCRSKFKTPAKVWLVLASLFFYGYWNPVYLVLICGSLLTNFLLGKRINQGSGDLWGFLSRKNLLIIGIVFNLSLLGVFKYADFAINNVSWIFSTEIEPLGLLLPLAISFFTFQQIAYLSDCYLKGAPNYDLLDFSLFVTFFPQLIAGPIVHHNQMMPQFQTLENKSVNWHNLMVGIAIFSLGLFKKVAIADSFAGWADAGYENVATLSLVEAWGATLSYTFQLYYDFSGYCDMAIGAALMLNIHIPVNFNSPYKALSIQDFWRRWHITLSNWLRDYVYIPLGGNRIGSFNTYRNLMMTFLLGGLWHGAGWTFVIWGALHGLALCLHRLWQNAGGKLPVPVAWIVTFLFVHLAWIFFRAESVDAATMMLAAMVDFDSTNISLAADAALVSSLLAIIAAISFKNTIEIRDGLLEYQQVPVVLVLGISLVSAIAFTWVLASTSEVFLYFNF